MGIKFTVATHAAKKGLEALEKRLRVLRLRKAFVKVGLLGSKNVAHTGGITNPQLASIHELGTSKVPARPFISPTFHTNKDSYRALLRIGYAAALKQGAPASFEKTLRTIGQKMSADIKKFVTAGPHIPPPLSPKTVARKGSSRPLVDTGQLVRAVDYEVVS